MIGKLRRNVGDAMSATDRHKMFGIVSKDVRMTETGMIDTETIIVIAMSLTTENISPDTTVAGRSSKVPTTTSPDKVTRTTNALNKNVTRGRRITGSRLESTNGKQKREHQQIKAKHLAGKQHDLNQVPDLKPNLATPGKRTFIIAGKKDIIVINVRLKATRNDQQ